MGHGSTQPESGGGGSSQQRVTTLLAQHEAEILRDWIAEQKRAGAVRSGQSSEAQTQEESTEFLRLVREAMGSSSGTVNIYGADWSPVRDMLGGLSRSRARQGFSPSETATFVFSLKRPVFTRLRASAGGDEGALFGDVWLTTTVLDSLGLFTTEVYQKGREEVIARQQQDMLELSTPVVKLWDGILALPLIGTLDSARTQVVMETLLQAIVDTGSSVAILDITGVPTVDTLVSQHLLKTVAAARLMGAECIISGIRPQIAQTIVHLGVDLSVVSTKSTLAEAFRLALQKVARAAGRPGSGQTAAAGSAAADGMAAASLLSGRG